VLKEIVRHLKLATSISAQYAKGWKTDPDFKVLATLLAKKLDPEDEPEPKVFEVGEKWVLQLREKDEPDGAEG
jgi:hypothetical protein